MVIIVYRGGKFVVSEEDGCNVSVFTLCCFLAKSVIPLLGREK